jgi:hypothetical protein
MATKTLYLTDLDGTLLTPDQTLTPYTVSVINDFIASGGYFTYATARSRVTANQVTSPLNLNLPCICYNGAFIFDAQGGICQSHFFEREKLEYIKEVLTDHGVSPIVYSFIDGIEKFSYIDDPANAGKAFHLSTRPGDPRHRSVHTVQALYRGDIFYLTCIGTDKQMPLIHDIFATDTDVRCIYGKDLYYDAIWCEILPAKATKAIGAKALKQMLGCDRLVVFGDYINDQSMFLAADESYAVANAVPELKEIATAVIGSNEQDGVARFIHERIR